MKKKEFVDDSLEKYWKGQRHIQRLATEYTTYLNKDLFRNIIQTTRFKIHPAICFSRNIGVGALELAEILGEKLGLPVADREIIEHIAKTTQLSSKSIATFDERYPGKLKELMCKILGDREFDMTEYARHLFYVAFFLSHLESTIFVGRGIHLMLPRKRVFAVRCISSRHRRIKNLSKSLDIEMKKAERILEQADKEQQEFFHKIHGMDKAHSIEFDMVLNLDYIDDLKTATDAIATLFQAKFPTTGNKN
ncbi:MAG: cytidylate kinase-like family protein [Desulfobacteraceae bacterium]|nr:cytidylate kinase-like family protein [Desulfobacteraceae bacterium]MBC2756135.1 cytidylate kinase-like family protein [Desulfobacteraceae bacterium]